MYVAHVVCCGVDIGSSNLKVAAIRLGSDEVKIASRPTPRTDGIRADATQVLSSIESMLLEVASPECRIRAVAVTGVGEDGVFVGDDAFPTTKTLAWFDPVLTSVAPELEALGDATAGEGCVGVSLDPTRTIGAWLWLRRNEPKAVARSSRWISLTDYPALRWTGAPVMTDTIAARTGAWDPWHRAWLPARIQASLGSPDLLPPVVSAGSVLGRLRPTSPQVAAVVAPDAVVVSGGHDHVVAGSAVERVSPGAALDSMGTAEVVVRSVPDVPSIKDPVTLATRREVDCSPPVRSPGMTLLSVFELDRNLRWAADSNPSVGASIDRLRAGWTDHAHSRADLNMASGFFIPGSSGGESPAWAPGAQRRDPDLLALAALWACAKSGALAVEAVSGSAVTPVYAAGGWSSSPGWMRLKERALGRAYRVFLQREVAAIGAAFIAADSIGWDIPPSWVNALLKPTNDRAGTDDLGPA